MQISVVLVDDHAIWRGGVQSMLEDTEFLVIGEASSGREAIEVVRALAPRLVLLDIRMAGGDGLDALQVIKQEHPKTVVVMLTTYENPTYIARAVAGGASGYLLKGVERDDLIAALRRVIGGEMLLARDDLERSLQAVTRDAGTSADLIYPLTPQEERVLRLVAAGLNNRDIASILSTAESTAKTHVEHIIDKLGVSDRVQAAVWATRYGVAQTTPPAP